MAVFTLIISPFFFMVTIRASVTSCFLNCVNNSSLVVFLSSGVLRTPFEVFSVLCDDTFTGTWANSVIARSLVECVSMSTSIKRLPERSLLMVLGSPTKPWIVFQMANVESLERDFSSSPDVIIKNLGKNIFPFRISSLFFFYILQGMLGHYHNLLRRYFSALSV